MKKGIVRYGLALLVLTLCCTVASAQQKPSQNSFAAEVAKIKQKKTTRDDLIQKRFNDAPETQVSGTTISNAPRPVKKPVAGKPSERAIEVPRRPKKD